MTNSLEFPVFNLMVEENITEEQRLDRVFAALADQSRRSMLIRLHAGRLSISELAEPYQISFAGVAKHVDVLERAGLVRKVRTAEDKRVFHLELEDRALLEIKAWLSFHEEFWNQKLDQLEVFIKEEEHAKGSPKNRKKN